MGPNLYSLRTHTVISKLIFIKNLLKAVRGKFCWILIDSNHMPTQYHYDGILLTFFCFFIENRMYLHIFKLFWKHHFQCFSFNFFLTWIELTFHFDLFDFIKYYLVRTKSYCSDLHKSPYVSFRIISWLLWGNILLTRWNDVM